MQLKNMRKILESGKIQFALSAHIKSLQQQKLAILLRAVHRHRIIISAPPHTAPPTLYGDEI